MYSTPGISHSSFSIGLVTRSSTSRAEAPGIWTNTSTIGTMICGSSSRGNFQTANAPKQQRTGDHEGRELRIDPGARKCPRRAELSGPAHWRTSIGAPSARPVGIGTITRSPWFRPESTSTRSFTLVPTVTRRVCAMLFSAT